MAAHRIRLAPSILMPRPLADLVYSLGRWKSSTNSVTYDVHTPDYPAANPQPWWIADPALVQRWQTFHTRVQHYYMCAETTRKYAFDGQPLVIVATHEDNNYVQAASLTNQAQLSDAIVRCVNEPDIFLDTGINYQSNHLIMTTKHWVPHLVTAYVSSYAINRQCDSDADPASPNGTS